MNKIASSATLLIACAFSSSVRAEIYWETCNGCNPTVWSSEIAQIIDSVFLNNVNVRNNSSIKIRSVNALDANGNCVSGCDIVATYSVLGPDWVTYQGWDYDGEPTFSGSGGGGGGYFHPDIIPGNASAWSFKCTIGGTEVDCATGEPK